jgi:hypothetical protein
MLLTSAPPKLLALCLLVRFGSWATIEAIQKTAATLDLSINRQLLAEHL